MTPVPSNPKAIAFFDGQNLFHAVKQSFGYTYPNYDPVKLAAAVCQQQGWQLVETRFYTGVPDAADDARWHRFWKKKLGSLGRRGVVVYARQLRYRMKHVTLPDGSVHQFRAGEEKGIDVRIAIDVISLAHRKAYDVAVIFSQDQDLSEAAEEIRQLAREQGRWIKIASAYPAGAYNRRGINKTDWITIDRATYDACRDPRDYR
jgi:uncharacterized LabA/DUF88 family protein